MALAVAAVALTCGGNERPIKQDIPAITVPAETPSAVQTPAVGWSAHGEGIDAVLATVDLARGPQRFAFVLSDDRGLVRLPVVEAKSYFHPNGHGAPAGEGPVQTVAARFFEFPLGTRGIYVTQLDFPQTGDWSVEAAVPRADGSTAMVEIRFAVRMRTESVAVGERPPRSINPTLKDVSSIARLTTGSHRDPGLYQTTIADAMASGRPTVIVFASPAFCTNAVCGPQVEVLSELREKYGGRANYVHIDYYRNPHEIQGDLSRAIPSPHLAEWGLTALEWTFVIGRDGLVAARFENFAPRGELDAALDEALARG
jgi:hypothetical protein